MEKGVKLEGVKGTRYLYHQPCHDPMRVYNGTRVAAQLLGNRVDLNDRCCGEAGTLAVARPDVSTQVRFRKREEIERGVRRLPGREPVKILTSCPSCLQGLARYADETDADADYIVVELAKHLLGPDWLENYVARANAGGIERVLL
jgi:Fe-S oxidoreductase